VVAASKLFSRTPVPERSATTDFLFDAAKSAAEHGLTFFLLGSTEDINARAAAKVESAGVRVVGRRNGYFSRDEEEAVIAAINASGADVLWVGLGVPFEYEFCLRNKSRLKVGWVVTCGGCFNFAAGDYQRAPAWMQRNGMEWLFRLSREPRRLFWRYFITNPIAIAMLLLKTGAKPAS
jgi:exopolysaccharide biosynthesis WecB/TagA/CpsF family protein